MERDESTPTDFAAWLRDQLTLRGYDLSIRGGGQTAFASNSGIGRATVSRILSGKGATDTRVLAQLASALQLPLGEVLVRAGVITEGQLGAVQRPDPGERRITPEQAADELGITDEQSRRLFINMTHTLKRSPTSEDEQRLAE